MARCAANLGTADFANRLPNPDPGWPAKLLKVSILRRYSGYDSYTAYNYKGRGCFRNTQGGASISRGEQNGNPSLNLGLGFRIYANSMSTSAG